MGRLERAPAVLDGVVAVADETGTVHAYRLEDGTEKWRVPLGAPPVQAPYASRLGFLLTTQSGGVYAIDPASGRSRALVPAIHGVTLLLPLGDGAVLMGGGDGGLRRFDASGRARVIGDATPIDGAPAWVGNGVVAWVDVAGVRFLEAKADAALTASGLPRQPVGLAGADGVLFATDSAGTLAAASLAAPAERLWSAPLGARPAAGTSPLPLGDAVFVQVDGGLVAVER
jgi:outer membrane protein assembly factor BamB